LTLLPDMAGNAVPSRKYKNKTDICQFRTKPMVFLNKTEPKTTAILKQNWNRTELQKTIPHTPIIRTV